LPSVIYNFQSCIKSEFNNKEACAVDSASTEV
jgi:hypothetical protein